MHTREWAPTLKIMIPHVFVNRCSVKFTMANIKNAIQKRVERHTVCVCEGTTFVFLLDRETRQRPKQWPEAWRRRDKGAGHQHREKILLGIVVLLPALCRPHFLKARLHFLQDFGGVSNNQLHCALGCFKELHGFLMVLTFHALGKQTSQRSNSILRI